MSTMRYQVLIDDGDSVFQIPDEMIRKYVIEFNQYKQERDRSSIVNLRDSTFLLVEAARANPETLEDAAVVNSVIKAHAMRQALKTLGVLYDA